MSIVDMKKQKTETTESAATAQSTRSKRADNDAFNERKLELKLRAVGEPDSIFILPYGSEGIKMAHMARICNKYMSIVKRKFGLSMGVDEAKAIFKKFDDLARKMWEFVFTCEPNLYYIKPEQWRTINDTPDMKKLIAHRKISVVVDPKSEEGGKIAMATKIIQRRNIELRQKASFDELEKFVTEYVNLIASLDSVLAEVAKELNQDYKRYFSAEN